MNSLQIGWLRFFPGISGGVLRFDINREREYLFNYHSEKKLINFQRIGIPISPEPPEASWEGRAERHEIEDQTQIGLTSP
ncbi:MAG: hypothetical protein FH752_10310 [Marinobacter adhaerens]|uniref:Uncharacterized protein n=1 Tax=Marinobacter adhaerens TaxID=1033846 RepID=A0A844HY08_9GAMM|nr:hypothetical protein [Marinobacter adhaerens]